MKFTGILNEFLTLVGRFESMFVDCSLRLHLYQGKSTHNIRPWGQRTERQQVR